MELLDLTHIPKRPTAYCNNCEGPIFGPENTAHDYQGSWCPTCAFTFFETCVGCNTKQHFEMLQYIPNTEEFWCHTCKTVVFCENCGTAHDTVTALVEGIFCIACAGDDTTSLCEACNTRWFNNHLGRTPALGLDGEQKEYIICNTCAETTRICACGFLRVTEAIILIDPDGKQCCAPCTTVDPETGRAIYRNPQYLPAGLTAF